ncbi:hypothetical protein Ssi03_63320 [Sphaerisporangium siamense]|uniref:Uncharacterized protein n=1 Tax=Sphaerisporangium siamense TaxID=795645 RepID=A0A7W7G9G3_9ACTN|nr:hypothetical protein [Sphaerisporangium siamense]MBB4700494.1 hypothetical protein [Sphaerisporangium siamense]GII88342.1 hypothetical protein Ssi03_63320 [Sphaerisporangium siamense]
MNAHDALPDGRYLLLFFAGLALTLLFGVSSDIRLGRTLREIEAATGDRPEDGAAIREHVGSTPGRVLKRLVARAWLNRVRPSRCERLAAFVNSLGAAIVGGSLGRDLHMQWTADLRSSKNQGRIPPELLLEALGNFIGSFKILVSERILEFLRTRYEMQCRVGAGFLDFVARSKSTAFVLVGLPGVSAVTLFAYVLGGEQLAYALLGASVYAVPNRAMKWQAERLLAIRTRLATRENEPERT